MKTRRVAKPGKSFLDKFRRRALRGLEDVIRHGRRPLPEKSRRALRLASARGLKARLKNIERRQTAATNASIAARAATRAANQSRKGKDCLGRLMRCMTPGHWYGAAELGRAAGLARNSLHAILYQRAVARGLVERALNSGFDSRLALGRQPTREPRYLWRLTAAGIAARTEKPQSL